ncbi:hypothetical protein HPP92_012227 [Vanilla planifolia]|uniref:Uncharacterized protein n=1 Tax=Vanilla planifolia TaxID=51239 RepID=A0A835QZ38_VANPL|nr:hypothetical protein HPP92_012227 [Vanilla planifolia]
MGSENEPANIQTSIALLQERFRQLQRMREMREKRELLRLFAGAQCSRTAQSKLVFQQNCLYPSKLVWSNTHAHEEEGRAFQGMGMSPSLSQWSEKFNETEVDTSLHL